MGATIGENHLHAATHQRLAPHLSLCYHRSIFTERSDYMNILVSACLLGLPVRYDGNAKCESWVEALAREHTLIPVCPEQLGGLSTPRVPCERVGDCVLSRDGNDRTAHFRKGAELALRIAQLNGCQVAILKQRSPSCGSKAVYDGTFTGKVVPGEGVTAELLRQHGIAVYSEEDENAFLQEEAFL